MKKKKTSYTGYFSTQFLTSLLSITFVLLLLGTIVLFVVGARKTSAYLKENVTIDIMVNDDLAEADSLAFEEYLANAKFIKEKEYKTKEAVFVECLGADTASVFNNPFLNEYNLKINEQYCHTDSLEKIKNELKTMEAVNEVNCPLDLVESMNKSINKITLILLAVAAIFIFISFGLINNTVRLTIFARRFLINTMKLVGASWGFIRKPFLTQSLVLGLVSSAITCVLLYFGVLWLDQAVQGIDQIIDIPVMLIVGGTVVVFGLLITFLCTYISMNKYLKMSSNDLYHI